ncbi:MAG: EamA family transporter, partial [Planctomycetota bacterium]|nr:EamA family transporter [Planctomycetota bacterium]
ILGALMLLGGNGLVTWAEQWVPSGIAALVITTIPMWLILVDWLIYRGARPHGWVWAGIIVGFAGVSLLAEIEAGEHSDARLWGLLALVVATISWAIGSMRGKHRPAVGPPQVNTALQMLTGGAIMIGVSVVRGELNGFQIDQVTLKSWLSLGYLITFGSLLAFTTYLWLLRVAPASLVATYAYVNPLVAVVIGALFGGEKMSTTVGLAAALILGAVALITRKPRSQEKQTISQVLSQLNIDELAQTNGEALRPTSSPQIANGKAVLDASETDTQTTAAIVTISVPALLLGQEPGDRQSPNISDRPPTDMRSSDA